MSQAVESRETAASRGDVDAINRWLCLTRVRAATAVVAFASVLAYLQIPPLRWTPVLLVCGALSGFSWVAIHRNWGRRDPWMFLNLQSLVDIAGITVGVSTAIQGQPAQLFSLLYIMVVVPASLTSVRAGLVAVIFSSLGHLFIVGLHQPFPEALGGIDAVAPIFLFFLAAQQCFFYAGHLGQKNRDLARLADRLETNHERLENLVRIARTLNSTLDAAELIARSNQAALEQLGAASATTFLVDAGHQTFRLAAVSDGDLADNPLRQLDFPIAAFPAVMRLLSEPVVHLSPAEMSRIPDALTGGRLLTAVHIAGLRRRDVLIGFLAVGYTGPDGPSQGLVIEQLSAIAEHSTIALGNAQLLEEARAASDLKTEFLSTVSHELRTPLNVIIGYTEMLRDGAGGALNRAQDDLFRRIETSSRELFDLIDAVLQVGRLESRGIVPVLAPVSLEALARTIEGSVGGLPRPKEVQFEWVRPPQQGVLVTDAPKVALVVRNLVGNAFKFTSSGKVTLRLEPIGERLQIEVRDTGIGIAPENMGNIFEMFRQVRGNDGPGGVGLGLHIVKQVVSRLGGSIEVESSLGRGSVFRVLLPRYTAEEDEEAGGASATPAPEPVLRRVAL